MGGSTKTGRRYLFPVKREYQYFLNKTMIRSCEAGRISFCSLVYAAEYEVEEDEEERHARGGPDPDVKGGVVTEYPLLVVAGELVEAGSSDGGLVGEVPGAQLVAHFILALESCL